MGLKIVCSGHLVRHPVGGHSWHHLQYLVGLKRLGHQVTFFEDWGWTDSCWDPPRGVMTSDATYGIAYLRRLLEPHQLDDSWCYLAEDGTAHGMPRHRLVQRLREADLYLNLSYINWIPELEECRRRVLVDTDPVFTQIGGFGMGGPFSRYDALFTYGENVHRAGCEMPDGGARWLPTRQPVVLDLWPVTVGDEHGPITTVMNWSAYGEREHNGRVYGQKDREFGAFFTLPREAGEEMEIAVNGPGPIRTRLADGGWRLVDVDDVSRDPFSYQRFLRRSRAEFCVAKHAYVVTRSGWFSDRSSAYLASGRPVVVQDTGFSQFLPCGRGLLAYDTHEQALAAIASLRDDYPQHCRAARDLVEHYFDARRVLGDLLERAIRA